MKNFNFSRFLNFARWDLIINRSFYIKAVLLIFGITLIPLIVFYSDHLSVISNGSGSGCQWSHDLCRGDYSIPSVLLFFLVTAVAYGFIFHNLRTKQGRVAELTLPASNLERILWHSLVVVFGTHILFLLSLVCVDLLNQGLSFIVCHKSAGCFFTLEMINDFYVIPHVDRMPYNEGIFLGDTIMNILNVLFVFSTIALGNALKYKFNIAWTIFVYFLLGIGSIVLIGILSAIDFEASPRSLRTTGMPSELTLLFLTALILFIWYLVYRLYRKAQITSKRNK